MSLYENLPGIELTVKDGNLVLPAEPASTQTVLIIGITTESGVANIVTGGTAQISTMKVTAAATATETSLSTVFQLQ
jgi:TRAP-type uncharacterized transport system fused permease subunit